MNKSKASLNVNCVSEINYLIVCYATYNLRLFFLSILKIMNKSVFSPISSVFGIQETRTK